MIDLFETNVKSGNLRIGSLPLNFLIVLLCHNQCNYRKNCIYQTPAARYQSVAELKNAVSQSYYPAQHNTSAAGNSSQYAHHNHDNANNAANADTAKQAIHDSASRFLHYVGIILLDVAVIFALFVIMFIIESVAFPIK